MPETVLIPLLMLAGTGVSTGLALSGAGQPSMPTTPTATTPTTTPDEQKSKVAAIQSGLPQLQERTGGSLAPDTLAHYAATGAGFPGQENFAQIALANWLG